MKLLLITLSLTIAACQEEKAVGDTAPQRLDTTFFAPEIGAKWTYLATTESLANPNQRQQKSPDLMKTTIERVQIYDGPKIIDGKPYYQNSVYHDGKFQEGFILGWDGRVLNIAGSHSPDTPLKLTQNPIPIAQIDMVPGTYWHWPPNAPIGDGSRVVAFETIKVPAGTFEAYKVSIRKNPPGVISLREYWFAPRIGIIKETNRIYSKGKLQSRTTIELTSSPSGST